MSGGARHNADSTLAGGLAMGKTVEEAAKAAGVSPATAFRRLQEPTFKAEVGRLRSAMLERALGTLSEASTLAAMTLSDLASGAESETVRLGAAKAVLEIGTRLREHVDFDERIAALERNAAGLDATKRIA